MMTILIWSSHSLLQIQLSNSLKLLRTKWRVQHHKRLQTVSSLRIVKFSILTFVINTCGVSLKYYYVNSISLYRCIDAWMLSFSSAIVSIAVYRYIKAQTREMVSLPLVASFHLWSHQSNQTFQVLREFTYSLDLNRLSHTIKRYKYFLIDRSVRRIPSSTSFSL